MEYKSSHRGSYTIEATFYIPMMLFMILIVLRGGIRFYEESKLHEVYEKLDAMNAVEDFYTYQVIEEVGKEWKDD